MLKTVLAGAAFALAAGSAPLQVQAQAQAPAARTTYVFEQNIMTQAGDGSMQTKTVPAHLVLEQKGDSVIATWQLMNPERPSRVTELRGIRRDGRIELRSGPLTARLQGDGGEREIQTYQTYTLSINGDVITGTIDTESADGSVQIPSRQITGRKQ